MKNKVLVAMGIGITAALAPVALGNVEAKAEDLDFKEIAEENKNNADTIIVEEKTEGDLNNDDDMNDSYKVENNKDAWNEITNDPISEKSDDFVDPVELATVTFTDNYDKNFGTADDPDAVAEFNDEEKRLSDEGYIIDNDSPVKVTDYEKIDPNEDINHNLNESQKDDRIQEIVQNNENPDYIVSADEEALNLLKADYIKKGYKEEDIVFEKDAEGKLTGKVTATKKIGIGELDSDPKENDIIKDNDGKTYTVIEVNSDNKLKLKDANDVTYDATWNKEQRDSELKILTEDEFNKLSDDEKNASPTPDYSPSSNAVATLDNLSEFNIIALNNLENKGNINAAVYVGGTYTDDGNGEYVGNKVPSLKPQSYVFKLSDDNTTQFRDGNINNGSTREPSELTSEQVAATAEYWNNYITLLGKSNSANVTKIIGDFEGGFVTGNGNNSSMNHETKIYYTEEAIKITVKRLDGILIAPYANVTIQNGDSDKTDAYAGVVIAYNVKNECNVALANENKGLLKKMYGVNSPIYERTWAGDNHVETDARYKISADEISHMDLVLQAHKETSKTFYGERYIAPAEPPAAPPELPPSGGGGGDTAPTTPPPADSAPTAPAPAAPTLNTAPAAAPVAAPAPAVLGARRGTGAVLGAKRGLDQAVLGARRAPQTGDGMTVVGLLASLGSSLTGAGFSARALKKSKKEEDAEK